MFADFTPLSSGSALFFYYAGDGTQTLWMTHGSSATEVTVAGTGTPRSNASRVVLAINLGQVLTFPYNFCRSSTLPTNGKLLPISQNQALFALLGTQYGGD